MKSLTKYQEKLIEDNINLAYKFAHKSTQIYNYDFDESLSIAFLGLVKAAIYYNAEKSKFSTYAYTAMNNEFIQLKRKENKYKGYTILSLEDILSNDTEDLNIKDIIIDSEDCIDTLSTKLQFNSAYKLLNDTEKIIIKLLANYTQQQISKMLGVSQAKVSRTLSKFKKLLQQ